MDRQSEPPIIKQEPLSRETTPFHHQPLLQQQQQQPRPKSSSLPPQARHTSPVINSAVVESHSIPCSQETTSTAPVPDTPVRPKLEETESPLVQESPSSNNPSSGRRKKRKSRRGKAAIVDTSTPLEQPPPPPAMNLTHANKQWFDIFQSKQSSQSISTIATDNHHHQHPSIRIEEQFNYVKEILQRSLGWILLPLRWGAHCAAIYLLPIAIALGFITLVGYMIFPRYIFSAIPAVVSTTTSILAFPARMLVTKTPQVWCNYVGIGCANNNEGEEVVRNATFATDLEVRNAFTVIHNLNYLNNSSNRLVLDSVCVSLWLN